MQEGTVLKGENAHNAAQIKIGNGRRAGQLTSKRTDP